MNIRKYTGQIIGSPERVTHELGFVNDKQLETISKPLKKSGYGKYLQTLL